MRLSPLSSVREALKVRTPLLFNVYDSDGTLLLARGLSVADDAQLQALLDRGTQVDMDEVARVRPDLDPQAVPAPAPASPSQTMARWRAQGEHLRHALRSIGKPGFTADLDDAAHEVTQLVEQAPDLAILQVLVQDAEGLVLHGVRHAQHTAIACHLAARRMGCSPTELQRVCKSALTMNISIFELQGALALQRSPLLPGQRQAIGEHPMKSRQMLEAAGVNDWEWLAAVEQHHERPDGRGYPRGRQDIHELAGLLNAADRYMSKLTPRAYRDALPADRAGREFFAEAPGDRALAALVKEFGIYPPGSHVALKSGEIGVVVGRGPTVMSPVVAVLVDARGGTLAEPLKRQTDQPAHAVAEVIPLSRQRVQVSPMDLADWCGRMAMAA
jgi:AraC-like DNA-binding protein